MAHRWEQLSFLHWSYPPEMVQRLLPPSLKVETRRELAWVGLVPFFMRVAFPHGPSVPYLSRFCETNVRTYVTDDHGNRGIWFFSLDAARLGAVITARTTYRLPYFWSKMALQRDGRRVIYNCQRRWPDGGATSHVVLDIGEHFESSELTEFDHWLTARWMLFSRSGERHRLARAHHEPWKLHRATVVELDDQLVEASGLPPPRGEPITHYSTGVTVRIGWPERSRADER